MKVRYYHKPNFTKEEKSIFISQLREVAKLCFEELPVYQILDYNFDTSKSIVTTAEADNKIVGFSAALELKDTDGQPFLHLGLTCVDPSYRGHRLTHKLAGGLTIRYLLKTNPFGKVRFTNIACVLSSLGNVAKNFENVYPSPEVLKADKEAIKMAESINNNYRAWVHIPYEAPFDYDTFTYKESATDMFQKSPKDKRYYHRDDHYNDFYLSLIDLEKGDEVMQTGYFSLWTFAKYILK